MRPILDTRALAAFVAVAETLSFRQAAELLNISQPPLSRTIKSVEARLGCALFRRDKRAVQLTPAGRILLPRARRILKLLDEAAVAAGAASGARILRIGMTTAVVHGALAQSISHAAHLSDIETTLTWDTSPRLVRALRSHRLDAALIAHPGATEGLDLGVFRKERMIVAISRKNRLSRRRVLDFALLRNETLFWFPRALQPAFFDHAAHVFRRHNYSPRMVTEPPDHAVLLGQIAAGKAIALLPQSFADLAHPGVTYKPLREGGELSVEIALATRASDSRSRGEALRLLGRRGATGEAALTARKSAAQR